MSYWNYIERQKESLSKERKRLEDLFAKTEEKYENLKQSALGKILIKMSLIDSQFKVLGIFDELENEDVDDKEKVNEPGLFDVAGEAVRHDPEMTPKAETFVDTKNSFDDYWTKEEEEADDVEDSRNEQDSQQQKEVLEYTDNDDSDEAEEETSANNEDGDENSDDEEDDEEDEDIEDEEREDYFRSLWNIEKSERKKKDSSQGGNSEVRVTPIGVPVSSDEDEKENKEDDHESFVKDMKKIRGMFSVGKRN